MANEVNANINIDIDTTAASAGLKALQSQISSFNKSIVASNASVAAAQRDMLSTLTSQIGATKAFSTSMVSVESSVSRLGKSIDRNKLSLGEYFRYGVASSKNFGRVFGREHNEIMGLAADRVKRLQTQYVALGQTQDGFTKTMAVRPLKLFNADAAIATQRQQLFNKLLNNGSTSMINFGKNTQWSGRQLMVGFTVPLTIFGGVAGKIFMDLERQVVNFRRVYGDAMTPAGETDRMVKEIQEVAKEFTKYGIAVKDTVGLAADVAAAGGQGDDLIAATAQSTRLATLGMIDMNQAMTATMALQTAFKLSNEELAQSVDFLNAVENQTVLSLDDVTVAIPKVAPIIKGLGGDVQDLAIFLTAMREGGVNAAEGANALKSGLASLINPTKGARDQLEKVGINIDSILSKNKGDIRAIVTEFGSALGTLDKFGRQQTLAKVFGKYQFARLGALFENISVEGSQAQRVVDLTGQSFEQLNDLAEKELTAIEESVGMKFTGAIERAKLAIAPIGEVFLRVATPIIDGVTKILEKFNELSPGVKQFLAIMVAGLGVVVPVVVMLIGLFANFAGQAIKGAALLNGLFNRIRSGGSAFDYLSEQELDAAAAAASLEGKTNSLTGALNVQRSAVINLTRAFRTYASSAKTISTNLPQSVRGQKMIGMATGGLVPGKGNKDTVPAMLTPGESVITKDATEKYAPILQAMNEGKLPGFVKGVINVEGTSVPLDVFSGKAEGAIQRRVDLALKNQVATAQQILAIFQQVKDQAKISATSLSKINESVFPAPKESSLHSARSAGIKGSLQSQLMEAGKEQEYLRALDARAGVEKGVNEYYDQQVNLAKQGNASEEQIKKLGLQRVSHLKSMTQLDRAHIVELSVAQKKGAEAWSPDLWVAQTQAENQLSTILTSRQQGGVEQNKNTELYLRELKKSDASQQMIESITSKVTRGVALTEKELQVQAKVLKKMLATAETMAMTTPKFGAYASGSIGAAEARASSSNAPYVRDVASAQAKATAMKTIDSMGDKLLINSPSEAAAQIGDSINEGVAKGIKRSTPKPVSAAKNMATQVLKETNQVVARSTRSASRPQGPATATQAQLNAQRRAERKLRGPATGGGGLSPLAFRAGEETTRIQNIGNAQDAARREQINRAHDEAIEENSRRLKGSSGELGKQQGRMKRFGSALKDGSLKMQGVMFGLDGLVFAASMMDNGMGQFAQKILPVMFAVQGLTGVIQLFEGQFKKLALAMGSFGLVALAAVAVVAGMLLMKKMADDTAARGKELGEAMMGTSKSMKATADFFGRKTFEQKLTEMNIRAAGGKVATEEKASEAQGFLDSEPGQKLLSDIRLAKETGGSELGATALQNQIKSLLLSGAIAPEMGIAIAQEISSQLEDQDMSIDTTANLIRIVGSNGENLLDSDGRMKIIADIIGDTTIFEDAMAQAGLIWDGSSFISQIAMIVTGSGTADILAENFGAQVAGQQRIVSEEMDRAEVRFRNGKMSIDEYVSSIANLSTTLETTDYASSLEELFRTTDGFDTSAADRFGQSLVDGLRQSLNMTSLGAKGSEDFLKSFDRTIGIKAGARGSKMFVNMFSPESVREAVEAATKSGQTELARSLQTDFEAIMDLSLKIESGEISAQAVADMINDGKLPKDIIAELSVKTDMLSKDLQAAFTAASRSVDMSGPAGKLLLDLRKTLENADSLPVGVKVQREEKLEEATKVILEAAQKGINIDAVFAINGLDGLREATRIITKLDKLPTPLTKERVARFLKEEDPEFFAMINNFEGLEDYQVKEFVSLYRTVMLDPEQMSATAYATGTANLPGVGSADQKNIARGEILDKAKAFESGSGKKDPVPVDDSGGGGSATKSFLDDLISETESNLKLFPGMIDKIKNKFPGIPQQIIEAIGGGEEGVKKAQELLGASKQKVKKLIADYKKSSIAQALQNIEDKNMEKKRSIRAENILTQQGFDPEDAKSLASNSEDAFAIIQASLTMTEKDFENFLKPYREYIELNKEAVDPNVKLKKEIDALNDSFKKAVKPIDDQIESQQELIESINEEIEAIEKLNDADELSIRTKQREVEMLDRSIEAKERLNDADQRTIDGLSREDALRNRVADSLSKELETMSDQEDQIRKSYDERIKSLEKVEKANQRVLDQEKDRLDVSRALAEGDIFAATAAVQQAKQNQVQASQEDFRNALQQGVENQVAGLRTGGGLTREQAEAQIESIKQQSYQTSLLIQGIEDKIFARNLEIRNVKDEIQAKNDAIRVIEDAIYERETFILGIQKERLEPAQTLLDNLVDQKDELQKILESKVDDLEVQIEQNDLTVEQRKNVDDLAVAWSKVAEQIKNARDLAEKRTNELIRPTRTAGESGADFRARLNSFREKLAQIKLDEEAEIAAAASNAPKMFAGGNVNYKGSTEPVPAQMMGGGKVMKYGMGKMVKGYAVGKIVGEGSRDSVSAMLTPGEFVIRKAMVDKYGMPMLNSLNQGAFSMPKFKTSNSMSTGEIKSGSNSSTNVVAPMYNNYSVSVNVSGTNASADDIANRTISKLKQMQNTSIRSGRG